jgi:hypothetical protein
LPGSSSGTVDASGLREMSRFSSRNGLRTAVTNSIDLLQSRQRQASNSAGAPIHLAELDKVRPVVVLT